MYAPLVIIIAYSFIDSRLNAEWVGFTWHWYKVLLHDDNMLIAAGNSPFIALVSSLIAPVLGTMSGIAIQCYNFTLLNFMVLMPVAMLEILLDVLHLLFFIQVLNLTLGMLSIVLAHITFSIGFVAVIVRARLAGMDESIFEAARDLGTSTCETFR
jgi:spermidine/putrescine transport system permease protein